VASKRKAESVSIESERDLGCLPAFLNYGNI
jgi:hypothetical protein